MQNFPSKTGRKKTLPLRRWVVSTSTPAGLQLTYIWKLSKHTSKAEAGQ